MDEEKQSTRRTRRGMRVGRADENEEVTVKYWRDEREGEMIVKRLENR